MNWHEISLYLKIGLLVVLLLLGLFKLFASRELYRKWRIPIIVLLSVCALLSFGTYIRFGNFLYGHYLHYHDISHYYFGAKYAPEFGYFNIYNCIVTAEAEMVAESGRPNLPKKMADRMIRDLRTYEHKRLQDIVTDMETVNACKSQFTPERWEEFKSDLKKFYVVQYHNILYDRCGDMGYNGTPVWGMIMHVISNAVDVSPFNMKALGTIDYVLLIIGFAFIWWAFGIEVALIAFTFYFSNFFNHRMFIIGSILRFDWMAYILVGLALVKKGYYKTAAILFATSGLIRLFPVFLMFGLGVKFLYSIATTRKLDRRYLGFFLTYLITVILLVGASIGVFGLDYYKEFAQKMGVHSQTFSSTRAGLPYMAMFEGELRRGDFRDIVGSTGWDEVVAHKHAVLRHRLPLRAAIILAVMAMIAMAVRKRDDWEAIAFSYGLIFLFLGLTIYYGIIVTLLALLFSWRNDDERDDKRYGISYVLLLVFAIVHFPIHFNVGYGFTQNFIISLTLFITIIVSLTLFIRSDEVVVDWLHGLWQKSIGRIRSKGLRYVVIALLIAAIGGFITWQLWPIGKIVTKKAWQQSAEQLIDTNGFRSLSEALVLTPADLRQKWQREGKYRRLAFMDDVSSEPFWQYDRVWVLSVGEKRFKPEFYGKREFTIGLDRELPQRLNGEPVRILRLDFAKFPQSVYNFRREIKQAKVYMEAADDKPKRSCLPDGYSHVCTKNNWNYVGRVNKRVGGDDRLAIWSHPSYPPLNIEYPDVTIGDKIVLGMGLTDHCLSFKGGTPVLFEVFVGDEKVAEIEQKSQPGFNWHEVDTSAFRGRSLPIRYRISAKSIARRHFLWTGDVIVTQ